MYRWHPKVAYRPLQSLASVPTNRLLMSGFRMSLLLSPIYSSRHLKCRKCPFKVPSELLFPRAYALAIGSSLPHAYHTSSTRVAMRPYRNDETSYNPKYHAGAGQYYYEQTTATWQPMPSNTQFRAGLSGLNSVTPDQPSQAPAASQSNVFYSAHQQHIYGQSRGVAPQSRTTNNTAQAVEHYTHGYSAQGQDTHGPSQPPSISMQHAGEHKYRQIQAQTVTNPYENSFAPKANANFASRNVDVPRCDDATMGSSSYRDKHMETAAKSQSWVAAIPETVDIVKQPSATGSKKAIATMFFDEEAQAPYFLCSIPDCKEPKTCGRASEQERHYKDKHSGIVLPCRRPNCEYKATRKDKLGEHYFKAHGISYQEGHNAGTGNELLE
ncbi:hypothetical protein BKA63DRAFT_79738 [Paraphoma chrysanthemicola]|nr:hypothetical protein BKA63DRAFT_79738 [Paraphoma chrysanthemicola]